MDKPYSNLMDQICRSNGWVLGYHQGEMVIGVTQADGAQSTLVVNDFQDTTGQFAIRLWSPVAPANKVPADQALQINAALPHCALANKDGQVVVTATRLWNMANQADLTNLITVVTYYAHFYGQHYNK